jgi:hypothetical protein
MNDRSLGCGIIALGDRRRQWVTNGQVATMQIVPEIAPNRKGARRRDACITL